MSNLITFRYREAACGQATNAAALILWPSWTAYSCATGHVTENIRNDKVPRWSLATLRPHDTVELIKFYSCNADRRSSFRTGREWSA